MKRYQTTRETPIVSAILELLVKNDYLMEYENPIIKPSDLSTIQKSYISGGQTLKIEPQDNVHCNQYIGNHLPIETNIESMARDLLGVCEERKAWIKDLKAAVKEQGHDEILNSFYEWASSQGNFMGRKPVSSFLKNAGAYVNRIKPSVTNPNLDKTELKIAEITDNTVFFTGDYRLRLSLLIKEYGVELVETAFADFFQQVEDRSLPWAARDFLQRAEVMIKTILLKREQAAKQQEQVKNAYDAAAQNVDEIEEDEDRSL